MAFKMKFSQEEMKGLEPVPAGIYDVAFVGFKPKKAKSGESINLNGMVKIIGRPEYSNRQVFVNLNTQIPGFIQDFVHSFGLEMEDQTGDDPSIPGNFDGDLGKFKEDDPTTWVYKGPLLGQTGKFELGLREYEGAQQQDIIKMICKVPNCAERFPKVRHSKDMRKKG
jgi:hypothetical protein